MIRLSGPEALTLARRLCGGAALEPRVLRAVTLRRGVEVLDQALACYMPGPRSYTGEDVVELHGHGGSLNMERLLSALLELGAHPAQPGEFTRRAFLNGRLDLTQAEAVGQVIGACSERALRNAHTLLSGELGAQVSRQRGALVQLAAGLEARVDFAEELAGEPASSAEREELDRAAAALGALGRSYQQGRRLDGVVVALVGPVNAGKSSLFNGLLGRERALVAAEPGTTRDYLEAEVCWDGQRITLVDTAGERAVSSPLERAGKALAAPLLQRCELRLHVFDASVSVDASAGLDTEGIQVANKVDLLTEARRRALPGALVGTSALDGTGLDRLKQRILEHLTPAQEEGLMVARQRQRDLLCRAEQACVEAREALDAGLGPELVVEHVREALSALDEVTGQRFTEDVLDAVFSTFCIGK